MTLQKKMDSVDFSRVALQTQTIAEKSTEK